MENITLSIICNTYNHEKYISKCIEGFLKQKTDFNYEILIHDDASTDKTASIIRSYEQKYPNLIKPIYQKTNQYSKGVKISLTFQYPRAKGKYLAICEGDDFWIDENKLQKQVDALEKNENIDICTHAALVFRKGKLVSKISPAKEEGILSVQDVIIGGGGFVATNSIVFRKTLNNNIPNFRKFLSMDYSMQIHGSLHGGMYFIPEFMSGYNYLVPGSWTLSNNSISKRIALNERINKMLQILNEETDNIYDECIKYRVLKNEFDLLLSIGPFIKLWDKKYKQIKASLTFKEKIKVILKEIFPVVFKLRMKIK